ncbi:MAG: hypothetical protein RL596_2208 [Bacteroidota bacterium]
MNPIAQLNKVFDSRIRLGIMSTLMVNEDISFNDLKELMQITDGNNTLYAITKAGEKAFKAHLQALENIVKLNR